MQHAEEELMIVACTLSIWPATCANPNQLI
jgi:hypothetical protein